MAEKSSITFEGGRTGRLDGILDPLDQALARGVVTGWHRCAKMIQQEVVKRAPVLTGNLRDSFASADAIARTETGRSRFGLLTLELQRRANYWQFVEFGTRDKPARVRGVKNPKTGRRYRKAVPARKGRQARPFLRPGIIAGRRRFVAIMSQMLAVAMRGRYGPAGFGGGGAFAQGFGRYLKHLDGKLNEADRAR